MRSPASAIEPGERNAITNRSCSERHLTSDHQLASILRRLPDRCCLGLLRNHGHVRSPTHPSAGVRIIPLAGPLTLFRVWTEWPGHLNSLRGIVVAILSGDNLVRCFSFLDPTAPKPGKCCDQHLGRERSRAYCRKYLVPLPGRSASCQVP